MEKEQPSNTQNNSGVGRSGVEGGDKTTAVKVSGTTSSSSSFVLQWGNRKRLRCMKVQQRSATVRVDQQNNSHVINAFNLRQRPSSPQPPRPLPHRGLRNTQTTVMRGQSNGSVRRLASTDKKANNENHNGNNNNKSAVSSEKGGSSSGSGEAAQQHIVWPPKLLLSLTNKEKEEDFYAFKGSAKLPQRPKKRAKFIQRTLNLISPGQWLCDLTLERYEVREKKTSKKVLHQRPRGLKAMRSMESDSE